MKEHRSFLCFRHIYSASVDKIIQYIEGLLSIQAGENPRVIEEKLKSFLSPDKREALSPEGGGEE